LKRATLIFHEVVKQQHVSDVVRPWMITLWHVFPQYVVSMMWNYETPHLGLCVYQILELTCTIIILTTSYKLLLYLLY